MGYESQVTPIHSDRFVGRNVLQKQTLFIQVIALFKKSCIVQKRQYMTNIFQLFFPLSMILLLLMGQSYINSVVREGNNQFIPAVDHPSVIQPSLLLSYGTRLIDGEYGRFLMKDNGFDIMNNRTTGLYSKFVLPTQSNSRKGVVAFRASRYKSRRRASETYVDPHPFLISKLNFFNSNSQAETDSLIYKEWESPDAFTGGLVVNEAGPDLFKYSILVNRALTNLQDMPALLGLMSNAVFRMLASRNGTVDVTSSSQVYLSGTKHFPTAKIKFEFDIMTIGGPNLYIYIFSFPFPVFMYNIVSERESNIRTLMKTMGLQRNVHFLVTYVFNFIFYSFAMGFLILAACVLEIRFFTQNSFGTYFLLLFIWGHVICASAFLVSGLFRKSKTTTVVGYLIVFASGLISCTLVANFVSSEYTSASTMFFIQLFPPFALYRGLLSLRDGVAFGNTGLSMSDILESDTHLLSVYIYLACEWLAIVTLAWVLEVYGNPIHRTKKYLLAKRAVPILPNNEYVALPDDLSDGGLEDCQYEGQDVIQEANKALDETSEEPVLIRRLRKVYSGGGSTKDKIAVKGLSMTVRFGECLGFLGSNGAGKSTTLSMLCGHVKPTSGNARIFGKYIDEDLDSIYALLGVCPQDNVLWGELTGGEHLEFFGSLKGLRDAELENAVVSSLRDVDLLCVRHKSARQYSGGMKRRLSVAIAFIGNPSLVLLDEPTTGLDPAARKNLWAVIHKYKKSCALILTTHSMEEAENLCDRVAIFEAGHLRCIGTSSALKKRFEQGYKLTIISDGCRDQEIIDYITRMSPSAIMLNKLCGIITYEIPTRTVRLSEIFRELDSSKKDLGILDWCIANTTLEEVFVRIATGAYNARNCQF
uniref:ABC transporter domain-containing protein n=1 Tax=Spongospora subterranea TaxID=70186 RepID=A0A0H5R581_9EUKA|eukprot:CRZ09288.1 hypothetical protein [Spongospora subterranea]